MDESDTLVFPHQRLTSIIKSLSQYVSILTYSSSTWISPKQSVMQTNVRIPEFQAWMRPNSTAQISAWNADDPATTLSEIAETHVPPDAHKTVVAPMFLVPLSQLPSIASLWRWVPWCNSGLPWGDLLLCRHTVTSTKTLRRTWGSVQASFPKIPWFRHRQFHHRIAIPSIASRCCKSLSNQYWNW